MPANRTREGNFMPHKDFHDGIRRAVIEEYPHAKAGSFSRLSVTNCSTAFTSSGVTENTSVISSGDIPASRFEKTVCTGMRVPLKTQAPLTLPGILSTALHCDQSRFAIAQTPLPRLRPRKRKTHRKLRGGPRNGVLLQKPFHRHIELRRLVIHDEVPRVVDPHQLHIR